MTATLRQLRHWLDTGTLSSVQLAAYCHRVAVLGEEAGLNAFVRLNDGALEQAAAFDDRRRHGLPPRGPLDGIPISVKANIAVAEEPLTAGSRILDQKTGIGYNATVVDALEGAVRIGTTTMDEFGMGSWGTHQLNPTNNPLPVRTEPDFVESVLQGRLPEPSVSGVAAGGSSCGSAVSIAHGSSFLSLGSDTGGSVRLPAAWCGVVGLKPTYGRIPRHGLVAYASSLDTIGLLGRTADCLSIGLQAILAHEQPNMVDSNHEAVSWREATIEGLRVGIPSAFSVDECPAVLREAWEQAADELEKAGASVHVVDTIDHVTMQRSLAAYYVLASAEAASNLSRYDGFRYGHKATDWTIDPECTLSPLEQQYTAARSEGFHPEVARRVLCGTFVLSSDRFHTYYEGAANLRAHLTEQLYKATIECDVLMVPTTLSPPPQIDQPKDATAMFANDVMTVPASLAGLPALSVPVPKYWDEDRSFPIAMQLIGKRHGEELILKAAGCLAR